MSDTHDVCHCGESGFYSCDELRHMVSDLRVQVARLREENRLLLERLPVPASSDWTGPLRELERKQAYDCAYNNAWVAAHLEGKSHEEAHECARKAMMSFSYGNVPLT